jgi:DNA (cytosine-5)-methyltransferase 1
MLLLKPGDARNTLVAVFASLVAKHRPRAFIFENVEGFLTGEGGRWVTDLLDPLVKAGYCINLRKVNAANYGVPQHRKRVLAIGGLGWDPGFPDPTHCAIGAPGAELIGKHLPFCETVMEALSGLPSASEFAECALISDHYSRPPSEMDLLRFQALGAGQTMKNIPEELWHETFRRRAFRRVKDGTPTERRGGAPSGLRRLEPDRPSKAITSGASSEFVHPIEHRNLTLRECARLQTFPDEFEFAGTQAQRALLIGNAVPPRFASAIAAHLKMVLQEKNNRTAEPGLKSFVPTNSTGMSPALQRTVNSVEGRYRSTTEGSPRPLFNDLETEQIG